MNGAFMKKSKGIIAAALLILMLSGCYSSYELNSETAAPDITTAAETDEQTEQTVSETEEETTVLSETATEGSKMDRYRDMIVEMAPAGYDEKKAGVKYSEFEKFTYYSNTAERDTNVNVLLPPDYSEDKKYPVLYILHGFWDNEDWMARPVVNLSVIYGNLLAEGKATEMIIVLPYIFCDKELPACTGMDLKNSLAYDNFINDLTTDLMPFIESSFSVATGRDNTAITGFSMGGRESLFISCELPDKFGYVGAVCPAPGLVEIPGSGMHPGQLKQEDMKYGDNMPYVLFISSSKADNVVTTFPDLYRKIYTENGVDFLSHELTSTGHDHSSVKPHLYNYLQFLFK